MITISERRVMALLIEVEEGAEEVSEPLETVARREDTKTLLFVNSDREFLRGFLRGTGIEKLFETTATVQVSKEE